MNPTVKVNRALFLRALTAAAAVAPTRAVSPITTYAFIEGREGSLTVEATDVEIGIASTIDADVVGEFQICIPCAMLAGLLKECSVETVDFTVKLGEHASLDIEAGFDQYDVAGRNADEFPRFINTANTAHGNLAIPAKALATMLERVAFAAATEPGRYAINGVFLKATGDLLEAVGTDGRRMALAAHRGVLCTPDTPSPLGESSSVIVPVKMVREIGKLCELAGDGNVVLFLCENKIHAMVHGIGVRIASNIVEGSYPRYERVVPDDVPHSIKLPETFHSALRRANCMVDEASECVEMAFSKNKCVMGTESSSRGRAQVTVEVVYDGPPVKVGFRPRYLLEALRTMDGVELTIGIKDGSKPSMLTATDYKYVIMPVNK